MQIKPYGDRILVEPTELQKKTESGIIIPDTAKEKPIIGKVLKLVQAKMLLLLSQLVNNILYAKYGGNIFLFDNKDYNNSSIVRCLSKK